MKIEQIQKKLVCDTISCWQTSAYKITTNSYKGNMYLCENCYKQLSKLFKGNKRNEA